MLPLALAIWIAAVAGCAGDGGVPGGGSGGTATFDAIQREIFDNDCTSSACHSTATRAGGMSLVAGESYDNLVNVAPENPAAAAAGLLRVTPDDPQRSFLIDKVTGELSAGAGSPMPLGGIALRDDQIEMIRTWIQNGAMPGGSTG